MYALISRAGDPTPHLEELPAQPLGTGDIRVEVAAAGFTLFDAFVAADHAPIGLPDVIGLGFDFSGVVAEIGETVSGFAVGDRVAGFHGNPAAGARAHATEVVLPATDAAVVPAPLSLEAAAAAPLNALTARQALDLLGSERGTLLVTGAAGGVGVWALALAKADGWTVDALVRPGTEHLATGADQTVTEIEPHAHDAVLDLAALNEPALAGVRDGGRYISVKPGRAPAPERGIEVSTVMSHADGPVLAGLLELAADGTVPTRIAATRPLSKAAEAYQEATAAPGSDGRWLLIP
ncbi:alcohol dehydrogenase catalytic domain-containing protein [Nocardioides sp. NPDC051685]|uniref:alcohol dehydrogenase catalytic domain-containing protein n=1 Tax=Nocardioides sp. NPDC051685 TaxID=3364334 RepID=UPI0037AE98C9